MSKVRRTYLISGAAHRIGRGLANSLVEEAAAIIIHYQSSSSPAQELAEEIRSKGVSAFTIYADLASSTDAETLLRRAWDIAGSVDVLINNASIFNTSSLKDVTIDELNRNMMINAFAPLLLSRSFAELNKARKTETLPVIINLLDSLIFEYDSQRAAYHISKRILFELTKMTALEFAPSIRANAVAPGLILPPKGKDQSYLERLKSTNPLNNTGTVAQIAQAVRFLVNNEFVTGQVIFVDGGRHLIGNVYG